MNQPQSYLHFSFIPFSALTASSYRSLLIKGVRSQRTCLKEISAL